MRLNVLYKKRSRFLNRLGLAAADFEQRQLILRLFMFWIQVCRFLKSLHRQFPRAASQVRHPQLIKGLGVLRHVLRGDLEFDGSLTVLLLGDVVFPFFHVGSFASLRSSSATREKQ